MRVLVAALGSIGDLNPHLAVAAALADRGHEVTVASSLAYRERVERLGIRFVAIPPDVPDWSQAPGLVSRMMDARFGTGRLLKELVLPALRAGYFAIEPEVASADAVITGLLVFPARLAAERLGRPWCSTALQPSVMFSPDDPSVLAGLPGATAFARLPAAFQRGALAAAGWHSGRWMVPLERFRRDRGLGPPSGHPLLRGQHSPLRSLALFSPVFAPRRPGWPSPVEVCGFPFDPRIDGSGLPDGLAGCRAAGPPPLVFTLGSAARGATAQARLHRHRTPARASQ
ncbi:MAG: glycosyltransferase, partial [Chloroflexota bacterium]